MPTSTDTEFSYLSGRASGHDIDVVAELLDELVGRDSAGRLVSLSNPAPETLHWNKRIRFASSPANSVRKHDCG